MSTATITDVDVIESWLDEEEEQCQMIIAPQGTVCVNSAQWIMHVRKNCTCVIITSMWVCDSCREHISGKPPVCTRCKRAVTITWMERIR